MSDPVTLDISADELMTVMASRELTNDTVCFVGIGNPSTAANLARRLHAPDCVLIYESGCIGSKPDRLPLSIGDGVLSETADAVIGVPEIFSYWLQGGRINTGFLGAAQVDRFGNLNSTVIGPYHDPKVRLPGAGGAPEIAANCDECIIMLKQSKRTFVEKIDFVTSVGFGDGGDHRQRLGLKGGGPKVIITDLGVMRPDPGTKEFVLTDVHPGITVDQVAESTGWELRIADRVGTTTPPTAMEMSTLRALKAAS